MSKDYLNRENVIAIRGATTSNGNTLKEIEHSVVELISELILRNSLEPNKILSIIFTVTNDLDACFPASIARKCFELESVAFLDCQQMYVPNDVKYCIRLMALVVLPAEAEINQPYLRGASTLRSDRC
tara:strand:+ start:143 stop:526 length:384 start_codon:yes stop_codon:yes gene_type:complete